VFEEASVAQAYQYRPSYPPEVFDLLERLLMDQPAHVLDVGCGTGFLARPLAPRVERVDAIDCSSAMLAQGKRQPGGQHPHLRWVVGRVETCALWPPYALIVAGDSLPWLDWARVMPRFAQMLTAHGQLAILSTDYELPPWAEALGHLISRYSPIKHVQRFDLIPTLAQNTWFHPVGRHQTAPVPWVQPLEEYIASFHARASCSPQHLSVADAVAFDAALRALIEPYSFEGCLQLRVVAQVIWGQPLGGKRTP
jgi:SAM-dependent methyltransferase